MDARTHTQPQPRSPWREPTLAITLVALVASGVAFVGALRAEAPAAPPAPATATTTSATSSDVVGVPEPVGDPFAAGHGAGGHGGGDHGVAH